MLLPIVTAEKIGEKIVVVKSQVIHERMMHSVDHQ